MVFPFPENRTNKAGRRGERDEEKKMEKTLCASSCDYSPSVHSKAHVQLVMFSGKENTDAALWRMTQSYKLMWQVERKSPQRSMSALGLCENLPNVQHNLPFSYVNLSRSPIPAIKITQIHMTVCAIWERCLKDIKLLTTDPKFTTEKTQDLGSDVGQLQAYTP